MSLLDIFQVYKLTNYHFLNWYGESQNNPWCMSQRWSFGVWISNITWRSKTGLTENKYCLILISYYKNNIHHEIGTRKYLPLVAYSSETKFHINSDIDVTCLSCGNNLTNKCKIRIHIIDPSKLYLVCRGNLRHIVFLLYKWHNIYIFALKLGFIF